MNEREAPPSWRELAAAREFLGLSLDDLWISYFGVGGLAPPLQVTRWLDGTDDVPQPDHNLLAQALNEAFLDRGHGYVVRYRSLGD